MEANDPRHIYWKQTQTLGIIVLIFLAFLFLLIPFLGFLHQITFFGFPLDFFLIAQGLIFLFIGAVFWFALKQEDMDRTHKMSEDL